VPDHDLDLLLSLELAEGCGVPRPQPFRRFRVAEKGVFQMTQETAKLRRGPEVWYSAAFLNERLTGTEHSLQEAGKAALEWRRSWQASMSVEDDIFQERLASAGIDSQQFLALLADRNATAGVVPGALEWFEVMEALENGEGADEPIPNLLVLNPAQPEKGPQPLPFGSFIRPFLQIGVHRLRRGAREIQTQYGLAELYTHQAETEMVQTLAQRLLMQCSRTLVLELNIARLMGLLQGRTPEERYRYFADHFFQDRKQITALCIEYPVLARLMATTVIRWSETVLEFLQRAAADQSVVADRFLGGSMPGSVQSAQMGLSDPHRGGRGVIRTAFSSGLTLYYKPKSLAVDLHFQEILDFLNQQGVRYPYRLLKVIDCGTHGWVEDVAAESCRSEEELRRFYWRQGGFLALLYVLKAVDFHYENLVAAGEHPVMVDLEGLFHHDLPAPKEWTAHELAARKLDESVLRIGLLPMKVLGRGAKPGVDISGLGGPNGETFPYRVPLIQQSYTDQMHVAFGDVTMGAGKNRPQLEGRPADPVAFQEEILQGFQEVYGLLQNCCDKLLPILDRFNDVEVRHILRGTMRYARFLQEGHHPDYLHNGLDRDQLLDKLWAEAGRYPHLRRVVPAEQADLRLGDIPFFTARPGQRHLWDSRGWCLENFFDVPSLCLVKERLQRLNAEDCMEQMRLIRSAFVVIDRYRVLSKKPLVLAENPEPIEPGRFLAAAERIGDLLAAQAIRTQKDASWIGVNLEGLNHWHWILSPVGTSLYGGTAGIALFLAYLGEVVGRSDFRQLARIALEPARRHLQVPDAPGYANIGAFSGRASLMYALVHASVLWQEPDLLHSVLEGLSEVEREVAADENLDLLGGAAGCAVVLLQVFRLTGSERALAIARKCGDHLLTKAIPMERGIGWRVRMATRPLAGFSHGAAGIAWALLELSAVTGDHRYREAALNGLEYERSLFVAERGNWADLRFVTNGPQMDADFMPCTWCHGAPGVLLGRLLALPYVDDGVILEEIDTALCTTMLEGFGDNQCLCHGDLGNADVLLHAAAILGRSDVHVAAVQSAANVLREVEAGRYRCGLPKGTETPGLMLGLAGIGLGLLRFGAPDRVPSVLRLQPPITK